MSSQFEKRKAKAEQTIKEKREKIRESSSEDVETSIVIPDMLVKEAGAYSHEGYDICLAADGRKYEAIVFRYDPRTQNVKIEEVLPVQRQVALSYINHKKALKTLIKRK